LGATPLHVGLSASDLLFADEQPRRPLCDLLIPLSMPLSKLFAVLSQPLLLYV
jgi:hypothetical protein